MPGQVTGGKVDLTKAIAWLLLTAALSAVGVKREPTGAATEANAESLQRNIPAAAADALPGVVPKVKADQPSITRPT